MIKIDAINLPDAFDIYKNLDKKEKSLEPISKINILVGANNSRKGGYKADSGTIKNKVDFCEKALPKIHYEDLNDSTKEIIRDIYNFVYQQNTK